MATKIKNPGRVAIEPEAETPKVDDPIANALVNISKTLAAFSARLDKIESNGPAPVATAEVVVKRGPGRPKGSKNTKPAAQATAVTPKALPKIKLTVGEAKALCGEHWRKMGNVNKAARVNVRKALGRAVEKLGASESDSLADFVGTKIGEKSGKSHAHHVAEAIAVLQSDLD